MIFGAVDAERIKLQSVRSPLWLALTVAVLSLGFAAVQAAAALPYSTLGPERAALGVATLILVWRLVRKETVQPAISGFMGVGISALIAYLVGASKGYFLLGIWTSLLWAVVFTLSVVIRRPVVGYIWGWVNAHDRRWREARGAVLAFDAATMVWVAVFASRFVVQHHLYDADQTGWLGVARIAMGWPLTAVAALVTYLAIRKAQRALREAGLSEQTVTDERDVDDANDPVHKPN